MAEEKNKFQLNKGTKHNFDTSKGGKIKFDLTKDDDDPVVEKTSETTKSVNPTPVPNAPKASNGSKKWLWIIVAIIAIALLAWWLASSSNNKPEAIPEVKDEVVAAEEVDSVDEIVDSDMPAAYTAETEEVEAPAATEEEAASESTEPVAPVTHDATTTATASTPATPETSVSDDVEQEALKVIRGEYGVGQERKDKLGSKYQTIQDRVNELKREGIF